MSTLRSWLWTLIFIEVKCKADLGVLVAVVNGSESEYCMKYFPWISPLPSSRESAVLYPLLDFTPSNGCDLDSPKELEDHGNIDGKVVMVDIPNCTIVQKAINVQNKGGTGVIVVVPHGRQSDPSRNQSSYNHVNISLGVISENSLQHIKLLGPTVKVLQYGVPDHTNLDCSLIVIWCMAMFCIIVGASCSRNVKFYLSRSNRKQSCQNGIAASQYEEISGNYADDLPLTVSPLLVVGFFLCMCGMLMLLYYFYDYLVFVIIGMFCLAATIGLYQCLEPIAMALPCFTSRLPSCNRKKCTYMLGCRQILLFTLCASLTLSWFVLRKESYSWIMQDVLGIAFIINMLRIAQLPNFKICTILLILLFFYDIFFVFITPFFTENGESVMVEVATGGGSQEQMPMVLKVPHMTKNPLASCLPSYFLLGFGDIIVPGLLVSFCYGFEKDKGIPKIYFATVVTAYGLGLILTFAGLYFMANAQPALLYLVPCMLTSVTIVSLFRKEFWQFWTGSGYLEGYIETNTDEVHQDFPGIESSDETNCVPQLSNSTSNTRESISLLK